MAILKRLVGLYEARGFRVASGLNADDFDGYAGAAFTWLFEGGDAAFAGRGIACQEVYFLECLFEDLRPRGIFVVGNAFGWSTLALALLNPGARVVAIDDGSDRNARQGIALTNRIAREEGLDVEVVEAKSPADVARVADARLARPIDFAFIDGDHTNEHVVLDFNAVRARAAGDCVYLFHDVRASGLEPGFERARRDSGLAGTVLAATPSGMGILFDGARGAELAATLGAFSVDDALAAVIHGVARRERHRLRTKYARSLTKRVNAVRRLLGKPARLLP